MQARVHQHGARHRCSKVMTTMMSHAASGKGPSQPGPTPPHAPTALASTPSLCRSSRTRTFRASAIQSKRSACEKTGLRWGRTTPSSVAHTRVVCGATTGAGSGVPGTPSPDQRRDSLQQLIKAAAYARRVPQEDAALLESELGLLVDRKLTTRGVLQRTTREELRAAGISLGAAMVLKQLFPDPAPGARAGLLPTDVILACPLPPVTYYPQETSASTELYQAFPVCVEEWVGVDEQILTQDVPEGYLQPLRPNETPIMSSDRALVFQVKQTMIDYVNNLLHLRGEQARWVQSPLMVTLQGTTPLDMMEVKEVDFELVLLEEGKRLSFLETTRPEVFKHISGGSLLGGWEEALQTGVINNAVASLSQATSYASSYGCRYGAISTYFTTWIIKYNQCGARVSKPIMWDDVGPSALQALWLVTLLALGSDGVTDAWKPLPEPPRPPAGLGAAGGLSPTGGLSATGGLAPGDGQASADGKAGEQDGRRPPSSSNEDDPPAAGGASASAASGASASAARGGTWLLQGATEQRTMGHGMTGFAVAARLRDGREVVVKYSQKPELQRRLMHEAHILGSHLHHLKGRGVVELVGHGWGPAGKAYWLATGMVRGMTLDEHLELHPGDSTRLLPAATAALQHIHAAGVIHGDVRAENIIVQPAATTGQEPTVVFIDFGMATACTDDSVHAQEQRALSALFGSA